MKITDYLSTPIHSDEDLYIYFQPVLEDLKLPRTEFVRKYHDFPIPTMLLNMHFSKHKNSTALHLLTKACAKLPEHSKVNATDVMLFLMSHGADANTRDQKGRAPLHLAATRHDLASMQLLLNNGADLNALDKFNTSIFDCAIATRTSDPESIEATNDATFMLAQYGVKVPRRTAHQLSKAEFTALAEHLDSDELPSMDSDSSFDMSSMQTRIEILEEENKRLNLTLHKLSQTVDTLLKRAQQGDDHANADHKTSAPLSPKLF